MAYTLDEVVELVANYFKNIRNNLGLSITNMTTIKWIRLVAVVGAYLLLRPYLEKLGAYIQDKQHQKELDAREMAEQAARVAQGNVKISPNALRGEVPMTVPKDSDHEDDDGEGGDGTASGASANWGKKARKRQKQMLKRVLETEEQVRIEEEEEESDKEIEEFLVEHYGVHSLKEK